MLLRNPELENFQKAIPLRDFPSKGDFLKGIPVQRGFPQGNSPPKGIPFRAGAGWHEPAGRAGDGWHGAGMPFWGGQLWWARETKRTIQVIHWAGR